MEDATFFQHPGSVSGTGPGQDPGDFSALEKQLLSVVERDGASMLTPQGPRRRARKASVRLAKKAQVPAEAPALVVDDPVAAFDRAHLGLLVGKHEGGKAKRVAISYREHARSPFVVSLQHVVVGSTPSAAPRVSVAEALAATSYEATGVSVEAYAAVSADLSISAIDGQSTSGQMTPASFEAAWRQVYGRRRRVASSVRGAYAFAASLLRRAERVEREVVEDVEASFGVVAAPQFSFARAMMGFLGFALVATLPANAVGVYRAAAGQGGRVVADGRSAVSALAAVPGAGTPSGSAALLGSASQRFRDVDASLGRANALALAAAAAAPRAYRGARGLAEAADKASQAGRFLADGMDRVLTGDGRRLDERAEILGTYAQEASRLLGEAQAAAAKVDPGALPEGVRGDVDALRVELARASTAVRELTDVAALFSAVVGKDRQRSYLLVFQNQTELRATGGFMGSLAEVRFDQGHLTKVLVPGGGPYDLKGQMLARVAAPPPLRLINPLWQFQDVNWFPDFPKTAEKIAWMWSKAGQPTIDGVIAVNSRVAEKLLAIVGPIELPEYGKTITAENFMLETQKSVELEYDKTENAPKKIIGALFGEMQKKLTALPREEMAKVLALVADSVETKDIQISFRRPEEEALAQKYGWSGRLSAPKADGLALVESNIAGQKTDGVVDEDTKQTVRVHADGTIETTVELRRAHSGQKGELFRGVRNVSYLRAYVPAGATLVAAQGFEAPDAGLFKVADPPAEIDPSLAPQEDAAATVDPQVRTWKEDGWQVFGGWMQLDPGKSQTVSLTYRLPFRVQDISARLGRSDAERATVAEASAASYVLQLPSQSGKPERHLRVDLQVDPAWRIAWASDAVAPVTGQSYALDATWDRDRAAALLLVPNTSHAASDLP